MAMESRVWRKDEQDCRESLGSYQGEPRNVRDHPNQCLTHFQPTPIGWANRLPTSAKLPPVGPKSGVIWGRRSPEARRHRQWSCQPHLKWAEVGRRCPNAPACRCPEQPLSDRLETSGSRSRQCRLGHVFKALLSSARMRRQHTRAAGAACEQSPERWGARARAAREGGRERADGKGRPFFRP